MRGYWNVLWLAFWFLSQTLGFAMRAQLHVTVHVVPAGPAWDQGQPGNDGYDADLQSGFHYDAALPFVTMEDVSNPLCIVPPIPAYDSRLVSTIRIAGAPRAPPVEKAKFLAAKSGPGRIVLGEDMDRVRAAAQRLGAETFEGSGMEANRAWVQMKRAQGYEVYDIGPAFARRAQRVEQGIRPDSRFYNMERIEMKGYENYFKLFERSGKYKGGAPGIDY